MSTPLASALRFMAELRECGAPEIRTAFFGTPARSPPYFANTSEPFC